MEKKLKLEQKEAATVRTQLTETLDAHKTEMDHAVEEKTQLEGEMQKLREAADTVERDAN